MKTALITGATGQDSSYLMEFLLDKGYRVFGLIRPTSTPSTSRIAHLLDQITLIRGDVGDLASLVRAVEAAQPDEVYNLAAMSFVPDSWSQPEKAIDIVAGGVGRMLEALRMVKPKARFYQASSSEMFGKVLETPQRETTPFNPQSPYGVAKCAGHRLVDVYRRSYDMFACSGILFNHESPRRGLEFVTRKITRAAAMIKAGKQDRLALGNLDAKRDWGFAGDYVRAMWMMLQQDTPDDFVIATGETHTVREFCEAAFARVGLDYRNHVEIDPAFYRPAEVDILLGDPSKAKEILGWEPEVKFEALVNMMVDAEQV